MKWGSSMECVNAKIIANQCIAPDIYEMQLETELANVCAPGQFVQIQVPGYYLRRPISICEVEDNKITLVYKTVGQGTVQMSSLEVNDVLNLFGPLGNGFPIEDQDVVLIGGGVGIPPLLETAKQYRKRNHKVTAVLGFNTKEQIFLTERFEKIGCEVVIATMDGSYGVKGTVMDAIAENHIDTNFVEACGPKPMLLAINKVCQGYISLESRMACGIGACMGCVVKKPNGESLRVCKDGPVFAIGEVEL